MTDVDNNNPSTTNPCKRFRYDNTSGVLGAIPSGVSVANVLGRLVEAETDTCAWPITQTSIITDEWTSYTERGETSDIYELTPHSGSAYYHVSQTYWPNGGPNVLSDNLGIPSITYGADGEGRPSTVSAASGTNPVTSTAYNLFASPNQLSVTFGSGDSDVFTYDANTFRLNKYQINVGSQSVVGTLGWNANGSLGSLSITDPFSSANTQSCSFTADDLSRISQVNCGTIWGQNFSYDPFGNIQKNGISGSGGSSFTPTYQSSPVTNRVASVGGTSATYDSNGNSLDDTFRTYTWDADSNPITIGSVSLTYDALDRIVEQSVSGTNSEIVYSSAGVKLALMNGTTLTKAFVPLTGGDTAVYNSSGLAYFRHTDWLGSSRFASTPSQTQYSDSAYSPFGEPYASSGAIDPSFTGQNQDTTAGLYDFLFREQDPNQARWISPDPAGLAAIDPSDPQTWNRYAYTLNSPLNQVDPLGLFTLTPPGCFPIYLGPGQPAVLVCVVWPGGSDGGDGSGCRPTYFLPLDPDPLAYGDDAEADPQSGPGCGGRGGTQHSGGNSSGGGQHYYPPASRKVATGNACLASYNASALGKIVGLVSPVTLISQAKDVWMEWTLLPATKIATLSTLKSVSSAVGNSEFGSITGAGPTVTIEAPTAAGIDAFESTAANPVTWLVVPFATAFDAAMRNTCSQLPNFTLQNVP